jgi:hypothetical protein
MGLRGVFSGFAVASIVASLAAPVAPAAELTRAEYVTRAESVCKQTKAVADPKFEAGLRQLKKNNVVSAGAKLTKVATLYDGALARLHPIPQPQEDAADLSAWLRRLDVQNGFLHAAGKDLGDSHRVQAQGDLSRFVHWANLANDQVLGFGFDDCLFKIPTR